MQSLTFFMPLLNAVAFDHKIAQLNHQPQPACGAVRIVKWSPQDRAGQFHQLEITYMRGDEITMRYEATFTTYVDRKDRGTPIHFYRCLSAQFTGFERDFGCGDVGPFYMIYHDEGFKRLNPSWHAQFRDMTDYERDVLEDVVRDMFISKA